MCEWHHLLERHWPVPFESRYAIVSLRDALYNIIYIGYYGPEVETFNFAVGETICGRDGLTYSRTHSHDS